MKNLKRRSLENSVGFTIGDLLDENKKRLAKCEWLYGRGTTCSDKDEEGLWYARHSSETEKLKRSTQIAKEAIDQERTDLCL